MTIVMILTPFHGLSREAAAYPLRASWPGLTRTY